MMRTIMVVFTKTAIDYSEAITKTGYAYNTNAEVKVNDLLTSPDIRGKIQVVSILDTVYNFVTKEEKILLVHDDGVTPVFPIKVINVNAITT